SSFDDDMRDLASSMTGLAVVYAAGMDGADGAHLPDESLPADQRIELEQLKKRVRAAIDTLPEKERKLLQGYYFNAKTLEEAGAEIGQSKSWASRLHARAVDKLKELLREEAEGASASNAPSSGGGGNTPSGKGRRSSHGSRNDGKSHFGDGDRPAKSPGGSVDPAQVGGIKV
ncbi:MAG TPA: sigma-70 family RNA polymerase sigma factor, partial [Myxococcaceae bacterium]|nr:sigma-70 family RNA polymerase sigma factor [Myxococcaceae bacterium]